MGIWVVVTNSMYLRYNICAILTTHYVKVNTVSRLSQFNTFYKYQSSQVISRSNKVRT